MRTRGRPGRGVRAGGGERGGRWLLLVHQLPTSPSKTRVKTWRRLQQLGAVAIRNAVWVLPDSPQAREDFEWMKAEIVANKGEANVFAANTLDTLTSDDIVRAFRADRERSFHEIRDAARKLKLAIRTRPVALRGTDLRQLQRSVHQLRDRFVQVAATDMFGASGREEADMTIGELERLTKPSPADHPADDSEPRETLQPKDYRNRTWVTRPRPGIDRSGSAWLIRRFIDPAARFAFAERPPSGSSQAIAFDMYDVEFSHKGDRCTFEVLVQRFGIADAAVAELGRLVHDLDLKETRYNVPQAPTVGLLIDGLRHTFSRDSELLEQGIVIFESLYRAFTLMDSAQPRSRSARRARAR